MKECSSRLAAIVLLAALIVALSACGAGAPGSASSNGAPTNATPKQATQAEIESAFQHEWKAWKQSKYDALSQSQRDELQLRGGGSPREIVDQSLEKQAEPWKDDLMKEFSRRFDGYQKMLLRLREENHPSPQREQTAWFGALVSEVMKR